MLGTDLLSVRLVRNRQVFGHQGDFHQMEDGTDGEDVDDESIDEWK